MKFCRSCRRLTSGEPLFCGKCGRSYGVRYCPKLHRNPVTTSVCSQCGSKELSSPHQAASVLCRGAAVIGLIIGMLLLAGTLFYLTQFVRKLLSEPSSTLPLMLVGLGIGLAWLLHVSFTGRSRNR